MPRGKYSESQKNATEKYVAANYDKIQIKVRKGKKVKIDAYAKSQNKSVTALIIDLIEHDAEQNGFDLSVPPTPSQINKMEQKDNG